MAKFTITYNEMVRRMVAIEADTEAEAIAKLEDGEYNGVEVIELESWDPEVEDIIVADGELVEGAFDTFVEFMNIPEEEYENVGVWSDGSFTYDGKEYEIFDGITGNWSKLLGIHHGLYIYQTDNPV